MDAPDNRALVKSARTMGAQHKLQPVGWNDRPGQEYICFRENAENGDPEGLTAALTAAGWHAWRDNDDGIHEFSLYPAPERKPEPEHPAPAAFRYTGLSGEYVFIVVAFGAFALMLTNLARAAGIWYVINFLIVAAVTLPFFWMKIQSQPDGFILQRGLRRRRIPYSDVARVRRFERSMPRGRQTYYFVYLKLKSGKWFDLYLPPTLQKDFVAFLQSKSRS